MRTTFGILGFLAFFFGLVWFFVAPTVVHGGAALIIVLIGSVMAGIYLVLGEIDQLRADVRLGFHSLRQGLDE